MNKDLCKDSLEFVDLVFKMPQKTKQKWAFIGNWAKQMAYKYPNLALEYNDQVAEARKQWKLLDDLEKSKDNSVSYD